MMSGAILLPLMLAALCGLVQCQGNRPPLIDPSAAKELFQQVDRAGLNDGNLTLTGLKELFDEFDINDNNLVEKAEFIKAWHDRGLGSEESANSLFQKADTDGDGVINMDPDLPRVFKYFDINDDGRISMPEFVIMWATLSIPASNTSSP